MRSRVGSWLNWFAPGIGADMRVDQERFAFVNARVAVDQIGLAVAQRFDFAADQHQARFENLVDEIVVARLAVDTDDLLAGGRGFFSCH